MCCPQLSIGILDKIIFNGHSFVAEIVFIHLNRNGLIAVNDHQKYFISAAKRPETCVKLDNMARRA